MEDAAGILGSSPRRTLLNITLPLVLPARTGGIHPVVPGGPHAVQQPGHDRDPGADLSAHDRDPGALRVSPAGGRGRGGRAALAAGDRGPAVAAGAPARATWLRDADRQGRGAPADPPGLGAVADARLLLARADVLGGAALRAARPPRDRADLVRAARPGQLHARPLSHRAVHQQRRPAGDPQQHGPGPDRGDGGQRARHAHRVHQPSAGCSPGRRCCAGWRWRPW